MCRVRYAPLPFPNLTLQFLFLFQIKELTFLCCIPFLLSFFLSCESVTMILEVYFIFSLVCRYWQNQGDWGGLKSPILTPNLFVLNRL